MDGWLEQTREFFGELPMADEWEEEINLGFFAELPMAGE